MPQTGSVCSTRATPVQAPEKPPAHPRKRQVLESSGLTRLSKNFTLSLVFPFSRSTRPSVARKIRKTFFLTKKRDIFHPSRKRSFRPRFRPVRQGPDPCRFPLRFRHAESRKDPPMFFGRASRSPPYSCPSTVFRSCERSRVWSRAWNACPESGKSVWKRR